MGIKDIIGYIEDNEIPMSIGYNRRMYKLTDKTSNNIHVDFFSSKGKEIGIFHSIKECVSFLQGYIYYRKNVCHG